MTEDKGILIRNVYYMLAYAFQELKQSHFEDVAKEDFERIQDLFAEILYRGVSAQLKHGLYKEYVEKQDDISVLKGKLDINGTIRNKLKRKLIISCEFDELSEDNIYNRILFTTICYLIKIGNLSSKRKSTLKSLLPFYYF